MYKKNEMTLRMGMRNRDRKEVLKNFTAKF